MKTSNLGFLIGLITFMCLLIGLWAKVYANLRFNFISFFSYFYRICSVIFSYNSSYTGRHLPFAQTQFFRLLFLVMVLLLLLLLLLMLLLFLLLLGSGVGRLKFGLN